MMFTPDGLYKKNYRKKTFENDRMKNPFEVKFLNHHYMMGHQRARAESLRVGFWDKKYDLQFSSFPENTFKDRGQPTASTEARGLRGCGLPTASIEARGQMNRDQSLVSKEPRGQRDLEKSCSKGLSFYFNCDFKFNHQCV